MKDMTNGFLDAVHEQVEAHPDRIAFGDTDGEEITYRELWEGSDDLACDIRVAGTSDGPVMVYGHKSPCMIVAFLACLKAGHAYVPTDCHVPEGRVANILAQLDAGLAVAVAPLPDSVTSSRSDMLVIDDAAIRASLGKVASGTCRTPEPTWRVTGEDTQYVIFTSGSTGAPKGVEVSANDVANFMGWDQSLFDGSPMPHVFLNQALLSFDLSVTELVGALTTGGRVVALTGACESDLGRCFSEMSSSGITCWVSTPTFASMCLADPSFEERLLPRLTHFFFCGEPLRPDVVRRLHGRFPKARIINAYGPTESTVAVTSCDVSEMGEADALPVGRPRPGTRMIIKDVETGAPLPAGSQGEIVICGDTVAKGYLGQPDRTATVFGTMECDGRSIRTYRTGDLGVIDADGVVWCSGRLDSQVKLHGYRIELGERESMLQDKPGVELAAVVVRSRHGIADHLEAHVQLEDGVPEDSYAWSKEMRAVLGRDLPGYMVPRRIIVDRELPVTPNGKVDRKRLMATSDHPRMAAIPR
jgi:D-alanine--poly(phosphoribitol) ligase subunit 1